MLYYNISAYYFKRLKFFNLSGPFGEERIPTLDNPILSISVLCINFSFLNSVIASYNQITKISTLIRPFFPIPDLEFFEIVVTRPSAIKFISMTLSSIPNNIPHVVSNVQFSSILMLHLKFRFLRSAVVVLKT